ncbi:putative polyketide synthase [Hypomontagnella monticulosa]|nr:putative polyketide synthase [Hypomontagnella monticulosa]
MPSVRIDHDYLGGYPERVPVAICGMGMRLPGGIRDSDSFYNFLLNKQDARGPVPPDRFNLNGFYSSQGKPGSLPIQQGYWLDDVDLSHFDSSLFSMRRGEIENLDPQQRMLLEVVRETFENAAETDWRGKNIACYAATFGEEWSNLHAKDTQNRGFSVYTGYMDLMQANRISYEYDLRGPSMTLRVGCSGVGLGIHLACQSIRLGECSSAIVAGANIIVSPETTMLMSDGGTLSPDASSKTFDASANGYVRAEGVNCVYIKRLDEAIRDGNPIRAIIRATSTNADGKTPSLTFPNIDAQEALIRAAYRSGGLQDPALTAMVECHGTGTAIGDAVEAGAVARVFGKKGIYIGSVKPNLGHSEGASALNSIIKAVVELENRTILPNIKFKTPNPKIPWDEARLKVPTEPTGWPEDRLERISINSYGIGGTNVHVVLDSAASFGLSDADSIPKTIPDFKLLLLSAGHPDSLKQMQQNYQGYAAEHPERLTDLAYTLSHRREHLPIRGFCITKGDDDEVVYSPPFTSQPQKKVAFVFTGQGAQWPQMGKELLETYPDFLNDIREMDRVLQQQDSPPEWRLEEELLKPAGTSLLAEAEIAQPVCTALQLALCNQLSRWNVLPVAVIGHSSGEIAAAYAAGSLSMRDAILLAYYRGTASKAQTRAGAMAAVGLGYDEVAKWLRPGVVIACENSPASVTLSGDADALGSVLSTLQKEYPDAFQRLLKVNKAYHSHHMQAVGQLYDGLVANHLNAQQPKIPFFSTVAERQLYKAEDFGAHYWRQNLESPVWFNQGFTSLLESDIGKDAIYLEAGPHSALAGPIKQIYRAQNASNPYLPALTRGMNGVISFLSCVGELYSRGVDISYPLPSVMPKALHDLPLYPWHHTESWWSESRSMKASRFQKFPHHDLLGVRTIESSDLEPVWRNILRLGDVPWLRDHCVGSDIVFPAAGYIAIAGHAVRQITGLNDFTVRAVSFKTAMILDETLPTEIITKLQPQRLTNSLNSSFFEFSIQSHNGSAWTQHCSGLVMGGQASPRPKPTVTTYSRTVDSKRWYRAMSKAGLRYGPRFTGLDGITAGVSDNVASAVVRDSIDPESPYALHPTTIDYILQLSLVAMHQGQPRFMKQSHLPTFIEEIYIKGGADEQIIYMNTAVKQQSTDAHGLVGDALVFSLTGLEFTNLDAEEDELEDQYETAQLVWKPHIDFAEPTSLIKPVQQAELSSINPLIERIFLLCVIDVMEDIKDVTPMNPHLDTYRTWLSQQLEKARKESYPLVPDAKNLFALGNRDRKELIRSLVASHTEGTMVPGSRILFRCYENMSDIFDGKTEPLELMRRDGLLGQYYDCLQDKHEYKDFLQLLGHLRPHMNVLEIGAGTGGLTAKILDFLQSESGEELYQEYMYTDISSGFFVSAKERFHDHPRIRYDVLDISKDPVEQGFPDRHYDLIIASNILHATPYLTETLKHTKTLLKPDGRLLLQELCPVSNWTNFIFGLFPGWWLGKDDGRVDEPYISPEAWDTRLRDAGFAGVDASALDADYPYQLNTMLVARPASPEFSAKSVTLLSIQPSHLVAESLERRLSSDGYKVDLVAWGENLPENQDVIFLLDLEAPFFDNITKENLAAFLQVIKDRSTSNFLWVTHSAQIRPKDPRFAQVLGMARTLRSELGVSFSTLEMQDFGSGAVEAICFLLQKIQQRTAEHAELSEFDPDREFVWANGDIHVGRMHWLSIPEALSRHKGDYSTASLEIGRPGLLNTLRWVPRPTKSLDPNQVRVKIMSVSMNFRELLVAMGVVPNIEGQEMVGTDSAGIVTEIGSNVTNVSVGDRVMALSVVDNSYTTELLISSKCCTRIPADCSFEDASTLPTVYLTVLRTLREKANLRRGQTILIHSAAGGVGIAAIHYAKWVGATIYATVSSPEKTAFLVEKMGVMREYVFYSRDNTFLDAVMRATNGRGVDVVLNSLSGELLHASWQCVAQGGSMIEIGKRDLLGHGQLAMNPFLANRSYIGVDVATLPLIEPDWVQQQLALIVDLYEQGVVHPVRPITIFAASKIEDAFRHLQKGQHIGKLVIQFSDSLDLPLAPAIPELKLRADRTYLLVGGMRGIGASIARWMVTHGAKNLLFFSRSAGEKDEDRTLMHELTDMGSQVLTFAGDVTDLAAVRRAVSSVTTPIAGVIQLAMVLADIGVMDMDIEKWNAAVKPKVNGTWNLHEALPADLDFFVMASSLSGMFGQYGQSNYAAANTFLDAFAQFRHSRGLAASTVDLGVVDEIGFVSRNASIHRQVVQQMSAAISEESLLNCFHLAIIHSHPLDDPSQQFNSLDGFRSHSQLIHGLLSKTGIAKGQFIWRRDIRTALSRVHQQKGDSTTDSGETKDGGLKGFLSAVQDNPEILQDASSVEIAGKEIARQVSIYTMRGGDKEIDLKLSLQDFGVDSLVSIELRNWWKQIFGGDVTVLQLMNSGSFMGLGQKAVDQLKQKHLKV